MHQVSGKTVNPETKFKNSRKASSLVAIPLGIPAVCSATLGRAEIRNLFVSKFRIFSFEI